MPRNTLIRYNDVKSCKKKKDVTNDLKVFSLAFYIFYRASNFARL